jgi:hypothetical protein
VRRFGGWILCGDVYIQRVARDGSALMSCFRRLPEMPPWTVNDDICRFNSHKPKAGIFIGAQVNL